MLMAIDVEGRKVGIFDLDDYSLEYIDIKELKKALKSGVEIMGAKLEEDINPIYTWEGVTLNLAYRDIPMKVATNNIENFKLVMLNRGRTTGIKYDKGVTSPLVRIYDLAVDFPKMKYPCGQFICDYYAYTLLEHDCNYGLSFNTEVERWQVSSKHMRMINQWIKYTAKKWGYNF